jgi:hypothetical protein
MKDVTFFDRKQQGRPLLCRNFIAIKRKQSYIQGQLPKEKKSSTIKLSIQIQGTKKKSFQAQEPRQLYSKLNFMKCLGLG